MAYKMILLHLAVYCILQGSSEMVPEIAYEIIKDGTEWSVYPRNQIPERPKPIDTFVLMEGKAARIAVYNKSIPNVNSMSIQNLNSGSDIPTGPIQCESGSSSKCYVQIKKTRMSMGGRWEIQFHNNNFDNSQVSKKLKVHLRPSKTPQILLGEQKIITHIANYTIKPFDAFGCFVYNDDQFIDMTCESSTEDPKATEWNAKGIQNIGTIKKYQASYRNNLTPEHDGAQIDCIEKYEYGDFYTNYEDWIIVRIFFIHNGTTSVANHSNLYNVKPTSNDDHEACIKYVNCNYDSEMKKDDKYCVNPINSNMSDYSGWKIGLITFAAIMITFLVLAYVMHRICNSKRNKSSRGSLIHYCDPSEDVSSVDRPIRLSENIYCYIDSDTLRATMQEVAANNQNDDSGYQDEVTVNNSLYQRSDIYEEPNHLTTNSNDESQNDMLYSYAYVDSCTIQSALAKNNFKAEKNYANNSHIGENSKAMTDIKSNKKPPHFMNTETCGTATNNYCNVNDIHVNDTNVNDDNVNSQIYVNTNVYSNIRDN